jgi:hypothetical protein
MTNRRIQLPKDGLVEPDGRTRAAELTGSDDVEGHGLPITAPPSIGRHTPGHGGEALRAHDDGEDDVEGHRRPTV